MNNGEVLIFTLCLCILGIASNSMFEIMSEGDFNIVTLILGSMLMSFSGVIAAKMVSNAIARSRK